MINQIEKQESAANQEDKTWIVKAPNEKCTFDDLNMLKTDRSDAEQIIKNTYQEIDNNQFTTVLPLLQNAKARKQEYSDLHGAVQPIVIDSDECRL